MITASAVNWDVNQDDKNYQVEVGARTLSVPQDTRPDATLQPTEPQARLAVDKVFKRHNYISHSI